MNAGLCFFVLYIPVDDSKPAIICVLTVPMLVISLMGTQKIPIFLFLFKLFFKRIFKRNFQSLANKLFLLKLFLGREIQNEKTFTSHTNYSPHLICITTDSNQRQSNELKMSIDDWTFFLLYTRVQFVSQPSTAIKREKNFYFDIRKSSKLLFLI